MSFQLAAAYVELSQRGFGSVMGGVDRIRGKLGGLVSFVSGPVAAGMAALGTGASVAGMVGLAASIEQTRTQFATLLGSMELARQKISELQRFSASTPFQFDGLAASAKQLLAFGVANDQVIPTLRVLGDVAAATGNQVGELSAIYGKVKANGRLMTEALDQFNDRGIPVGKALEEAFGKTGEEIRKMASAGQISFSDLQRAMIRMTSEGGIAFNGMASQSTTLSGLWSTLKDNVTLVMTDIGEAIVEGFDLKSVTESFTIFVQRVRGEWMPAVVGSFQWARQSIEGIFPSITDSMSESVSDFVSVFDLSLRAFVAMTQNATSNAWQYVSTFFNNAVTLGGWFAGNMGSIFTNVYNSAGRIFSNMASMMRNIWDGVWSYISGGGFDVDFSPMVDSFNAAVAGISMPELQTPELNAYQGELDAILGEFAARQIRRAQRERAEANATSDEAIAALDVQDDQEKGITEEKRKQREFSASFVSLSGLANKMQEQRKFTGGGGVGGTGDIMQGANVGNVNSTMRQEIDLVRQQVQHLATLAGLANGAGLRVVHQGGGGGVQLPQASVQFGVTGNG